MTETQVVDIIIGPGNEFARRRQARPTMGRTAKRVRFILTRPDTRGVRKPRRTMRDAVLGWRVGMQKIYGDEEEVDTVAMIYKEQEDWIESCERKKKKEMERRRKRMIAKRGAGGKQRTTESETSKITTTNRQKK